MNDNHLSTYLNDHLAGAVAGIKLAEDCREHNPSGPLHEALTELVVQIKEDYEALKDVKSRVPGAEYSLKQIIMWLTSRLSRLKLGSPLFQYSDLARLDELEGLMLGIRGKLGLWTALETAVQSDDRFVDVDFGRLQERARQQLDLVELYRLDAAVRAFAGREGAKG